MSKKIIFIVLFILVFVAGVLLGRYVFYKKDTQIVNDTKIVMPNSSFVYMGNDKERVTDEENIVFTNYEDYYAKFSDSKLTSSDFDKYNYVLISIEYDSCADKNIVPTDYTIDGNDINVSIKYEASCGVCPFAYMYYLLKVDKSITTANVNVDYQAVNKPECDPNVSYKPLIYLYPEKETNVVVKLGNSRLLTTTYPKYNNEWEVVAKPNGELTDSTGRTYYGLYWEGLNNIHDSFNDGFVVSRDDTIRFLEEKLAILGLNERETNEFIIYWLPKLEESEYNLIRFESIDNINEQMPLEVNPKPDTIIRVFMEYKPIDNKIDIKEQKLDSLSRNGFTVVEWGGSLIK